MTNAELNLPTDETILNNCDNVYLNNKRIDELILTNINLIVVSSKGFIKKKDIILKYPLSQVKLLNEIPQVSVKNNSEYKKWELLVQLADENLTLSFEYGFSSKGKVNKVALKFANEICNQINGTETENVEISSSFIEKIGEIFDAMINAIKRLFNKKNLEIEAKKENVSIKCPGCGNPLIGYKNQRIKCRYCGTVHILK